MVTDRTITDVMRVQALNAKAWADFTDAEKAYWLYGDAAGLCDSNGVALYDSNGVRLYGGAGYWRGMYTDMDLNRVGTAISTLYTTLTALGISVAVVPKTDWIEGNISNATQAAQYIADVAAIRAAITPYTTTPAAPTDAVSFTFQEANNIEQILTDIDGLLTELQAVFLRAGALQAGANFYFKN